MLCVRVLCVRVLSWAVDLHVELSCELMHSFLYATLRCAHSCTPFCTFAFAATTAAAFQLIERVDIDRIDVDNFAMVSELPCCTLNRPQVVVKHVHSWSRYTRVLMSL